VTDVPRSHPRYASLRLRDAIVHVHLNDGRKMGVSEHLSLGEGVADFSPMAGFMNTFGGALVLEIYAPDRPLEATLESRDFILDVVAQRRKPEDK